jgi:hypothetical protein
MKLIRKNIRAIAAFAAVNLLAEIIVPPLAYGLTGGPSQPEVQSFEPIGTSDMVDVFSGDFTYNIPLLEVEGYPLNISYNSGITMEQEASWVGLGWNINPGVINRNMRGLPDDFDGDLVTREMKIRDNVTVGVNGGAGGELFGSDRISLQLGLGISYNNYRGFGFEQSANLAIGASEEAKGGLTGGLGISNSANGLSVSPKVGFETKINKMDKKDKILGGSVGCSYNSRAGLQQMNFGIDATRAGNQLKFLSGLNGGTGSSISFGVPSYTPNIGNQMVNSTYTLSLKLGGDMVGQDLTANVSGYYSSQRLANTYDQTPAYGYLNLHKGAGYNNVSLDFNREKDGPFSLNTPALPMTNLTYDIYSVMGQGIGGSYRLFRNDVGFVFDPYAANTSISGSLGGEMAAGNLYKGGIDISATDVNTVTKKWENNPLASRIGFREKTEDPLYEAAYFRESGEKVVDTDPGFFDKIGGDRPVRFELVQGGDEFTAVPVFVDDRGKSEPLSSKNYRSGRQKRNQVITYLTRKEMKRYGMEDQMKKTYHAPDHHIGQITTLRPDGARYIFGIAAYNIRQEETSFSVGTLKGGKQFAPADAAKGTIRYRSVDNTRQNDRGIDHYFSNTILPEFAHSYLLTAVLSADYVDIDGVRGPSPGDMGTYTRFHYEKMERPYRWRAPYQQFEANYNEGLKSDREDDQGSYIYGEKELWYISKIETKNYVAVFTLEDRNDGYGVEGKNGGKGEVTMKMLKKISLYSRPDYENSVTPEPIKEVHFEYDYSLCKGVPNQAVNGQGKLTLKRLYFTYGFSYRAKYNDYEFYYREDLPAYNPDYSLKSADRWGYYKKNNALSYSYNHPHLSPAEFPYTEQQKGVEDIYSSAWNLSEIKLPSGGKIKVTYESDDYAYVQNRRAMQMFTLLRVGDADNLDPLGIPGPLKEDELYGFVSNNNYLYFKLNENIQASNLTAANAIFYREYLKGIHDLYFRFLVNITSNDFSLEYPNSYEYVSGYGEIEEYGVSTAHASGGQYPYAWIKLKQVKAGENSFINCNPVAKAAWHFGRLNLQKNVYNQKDPKANGVEQAIMTLTNPGLIQNLMEFALGSNNYFRVKGYGKQTILSKSWIRLNNPSGKKLGGGCRVKKVELSDEWAQMVSGQGSFSYGQEYEYTTYDAELGKEISSGVASYEPMIGGDENPFRLPVWHGDKEEKILAPDDNHYMETPFGESFFPSPTVGYSKVTVKNLQYSNVKRNATGKVVHEFYTAKDFPTITERTDLLAKPYKTNPIIRLFKFNNKDFMTASQGFVVELNDMHGKQKRQLVYAEDSEEPVSGIEHIYQAERYTKDAFRLNSEVDVIRPDGSVGTAPVGVDYDFVADMRSQETVTHSGSLALNGVVFLVGFVPAAIPTIFPGYSREETRFKSATTTKVIQRSGILKETVAFDLGARVSTKNLAYDSETGEVLLTETINNFNDPVYSFNYPVHWYYEGMSHAYRNIHFSLDHIAISGGTATLANAGKYFFPGDEVILGNDLKLWVEEVSDMTVGFINEAGNPVTVSGPVRVIRSGRRNQQTTSMGSLVSLSNPLPMLRKNSPENILQANALVFSEEWKTYCECFDRDGGMTLMSSNPYVTGQKGVWRNVRSYLHLTGRSQSLKNKNSDIRRDGTYTSFNPFWNWGGHSWGIDDNDWTWTSTITQFNPNGQALENEDALHRFSTGLYGYGNSLMVAAGANLKYNEAAFDHFEDYDFKTCTDDHFSYKPYKTYIDQNYSHTGRRSLRATAADSISITKPLIPCAP